MSVENKARRLGYRIVGKLGQGGFGEVFLLEKDGQKFVLKKLIEGAFLSREAQERFINEYNEVKRRFDSKPHFPRMVELLSADNQLAFIMEYIPYSFEEWIKEHPEKRDDLLEQLVYAVSLLHGNNIAHRDLKPDNLRVREDGTLVIIDFGIAFWPDKDVTRLFTQEQLLPAGTILYSPPEVLYVLRDRIGELAQNKLLKASYDDLTELFKKYNNDKAVRILQRKLHDIYSVGIIYGILLNNDIFQNVMHSGIHSEETKLTAELLKNGYESMHSRLLEGVPEDWVDNIKSMIEPYPTRRLKDISQILSGLRRSITPISKPLVQVESETPPATITCKRCGNVRKISIMNANFCSRCGATPLYHKLIIYKAPEISLNLTNTKYIRDCGDKWVISVPKRERFFISIGRKENNDIVIRSPYVSREHAIIEFGEVVKVIDRNSTNGTFVEDDRVYGESILYAKGDIYISWIYSILYVPEFGKEGC